MAYLVVLVGSIIVAMGVVGIARPEQLFVVVLSWPAAVLLSAAAGIRVALGLVFILAAPSCRFPRVMYALGIAALTAAVVVLLLGPTRLESLVHWWLGQPRLLIQSFYGVTILFGGFLVYSGSRRP